MSNIAAIAEPRKALPTIYDLLERKDTANKFKAVLQNSMAPEKMVRLSINAIRKTANLGLCDPFSVFGALMIAGSLGLEPNTILGHAFLIPYKKRYPKRDDNGQIVKDSRGQWVFEDGFECQFQIGYKGYIDLMYRSGVVTEVQAEAIHTGDSFKHQYGSETFLRYEKTMNGERGDVIGSFCYTRLSDGQAFTVLPLADIHKARSKSETYGFLERALKSADTEKKKGQAQKKFDDTPWNSAFDVMAMKTAIRRHSSRVKISPEFNAAALIDAGGDEGRLNLAAFKDADLTAQVIKGEVDIPLYDPEERETLSSFVEPTEDNSDDATAQQKAISKQSTDNADGGHDPVTGEVYEEGRAPREKAESTVVTEKGAKLSKGNGKMTAPEGFKFG